VLVVGRIIAGDRTIAKLEGVAANRTERSIELLADSRELDEVIQVLSPAFRQCMFAEVLDEYTTIVDVVVLQAKGSHDGRSDMGVKRPGRRIVFMAMSSPCNLGHLQ
jgi:hypothetical protein